MQGPLRKVGMQAHWGSEWSCRTCGAGGHELFGQGACCAVRVSAQGAGGSHTTGVMLKDAGGVTALE